MNTLVLPTGRPGRIAALALTLAVVGMAWFGVASPLLDWYADRANTEARREALLGRMDDLAASLPDLRRRAAAAHANQAAQSDALLQAPSDATAGAVLQQHLQDMATRTGVALATVETLPGSQAGSGLRRIVLRVAATTSWSALVHLLAAIESAQPRMAIDDVQLRSSVDLARSRDLPISAGFSIIAFRAGAAP